MELRRDHSRAGNKTGNKPRHMPVGIRKPAPGLIERGQNRIRQEGAAMRHTENQRRVALGDGNGGQVNSGNGGVVHFAIP